MATMQLTRSEGEGARIAALRAYQILDTTPERVFDDLTRQAARACGAPIALISLVDTERQWFKAKVGLAVEETSREVSFCAHAIRYEGVMVVPDTAADPRFAANPLVVGEPAIRFYAGAPLVNPEGHALGTLCVIDVVPRALNAEQREALEALGRLVVSQLELRKALGREREAARRERTERLRREAIEQAALDCIITIDHRGRVLEFNPAAEATFGYPRDQAVGRELTALIVPPRARAAHRWGLADFLATGKGPVLGRRIEVEAIHADGSILTVELAITVVPVDGPPIFTAYLRDISERRRTEEALRLSVAESNKLALVASRTDNAVIITDAAGRIEWVNDGFTRISEYTPQEVLGRKPGSFLQGPETDPATTALMSTRLAQGEGFRVEVLNYSKSGRKYWLAVEVQPIRDDQGTLIHFMAIESDVTERKRTEEALRLLSDEALRESRRRLATVVKGAPVILFATDGRGVITLSEGRGLAAIGLAAGEVVGRLASEVFGGELDVLDDLRRCLLGETFEVVRNAAGRSFNTRYTPHCGPVGEVIGVIGVATDVTDRMAAEEAMGRAEARYRDLFEHSTEGIFQTTPEGQFLDANPALARIYGYESPAELISSLTDIGGQLYADPDRRDQFRGAIQERGSLTGFVSQVRRRDGVDIWIEEGARVVRDASGAALYYEGTVQDVTERRRAEEEIRGLNASLARRLDRIGALRRIDMAITGSLDLRVTLDTILDQVAAQLGVHAAAVLLLDPHTLILEYAAGCGFRGAGIARSRLRLGEGHAGRAALERRTVHVPDLREPREPLERRDLPRDEGFVAYHAVPLLAKGQVRGVLEVFHRGPLDTDPEWCAFLDALAGQAAIAVDNASLFEGLQRSNLDLTLAYDATIEGWSRALDLRDEETEGHTRRVTEMTLRLARAMNIAGAELIQIRRGALLHDIGKMGIPDRILRKPGPLTDEEWVIMRKHPTYALELLAPIAFLRAALEIPHGHHEKWDGTGYPRGLAGEQIPPAARIFAAVDIWDALRSDRPYRAGWPEDRVRAHIAGLSGTHLDPEVVRVFLALLAATVPD